MALPELIRQCKKYDKRAQGELYKLVAGKLYGVCLRYAKNRFEAEDYLQEAFIRIFKYIHTFEEDGPFEAWARKVTVNCILKSLKKKNVLNSSQDLDHAEEIVESNESPEQQIYTGELLKTLDILPEGKRAIFNLYAIEGYSHQEIAEQLSISVGTSKSQLAKAKAMLQEEITSGKNL